MHYRECLFTLSLICAYFASLSCVTAAEITLITGLKHDFLSSKFEVYWFLIVSLSDEFKPASIDKNQRGTLHKSKDNKVAVEFQNIQPGKPKVAFEGSSEDYKDNDAVLFFDGESFRLERLHRAVKRLRHKRMLGESTGAASVAASAGVSDASSPPVGKGIKNQPSNKDTFHAVPVGFFLRLLYKSLLVHLPKKEIFYISSEF